MQQPKTADGKAGLLAPLPMCGGNDGFEAGAPSGRSKFLTASLWECKAPSDFVAEANLFDTGNLADGNDAGAPGHFPGLIAFPLDGDGDLRPAGGKKQGVWLREVS